MERLLYIEKFRNLGLEGPEKLVLNSHFQKGKMGNLIIVVGANNSGKSNVLDALYSLGKRVINSRDVTNLSYEDEYRKPSIKLVCKNDKESYSYKLNYNKEDEVDYPTKGAKVNYKFIDNLSNLSKILSDFMDYLKDANSYSYRNYYSFYIEDYNAVLDLISKSSIDKEKIQNKVLKMMEKIYNGKDIDDHHSALYTHWSNFVKNSHNQEFDNEIKKYMEQSMNDVMVNNAYKGKFGIDFLPNVYRYEEKSINNQGIITNINELRNNKFFTNIFDKLNINISSIENAYEVFNDSHNRGALTTLEKQIKTKLKVLADDFNSLYFNDDIKYEFAIRFESSSIYFEIYRGSKDLSLDYQSTGFRWFFNLYFNLLCKNTLKAGDIIIMDEPATNLHVKGQQELRKFLKDFTLKNDLTIVLATHSPFLIDVDYLDELRVIVNKDNVSSICNDFSTFNPSDPDSLKPIKEALTVHSHILYDPNSPVIFVEGITDYNYLVAFKKILNIEENIVFLPIEGIGNMKNANHKEQQLKISQALIRINSHNPILLCDGDNAGLAIKKLNKNDSMLNVVTLIDIDPTFQTIESLFDNEDLKKYNLMTTGGKYIKHSSNSSLIKNFYQECKFSQKTLNNFKKVFEYLFKLI